MARKINVRNIGLILGVTGIDMAVGFHDRLVRQTGIIKFVQDTPLGTAVAPQSVDLSYMSSWNSTTSYTLESTAGISGISAVIVIVIAIVAAFLACGFFSMGGGGMD